MKRAFGVMAALLGLMFLPGCTAALVMHAEKEEMRDNRASETLAAWRDGQGRLTVCARGWPSGRAHQKDPVDFHFSVPLVRTDGGVRRSPHPGVDQLPVPTVAVAPGAIGKGCPEPPGGAMDVTIAMLPTDRHGRLSPDSADAETMERVAAGDGALLYGVPAAGEPPALLFLYRHEEPIFGGSPLAWIDPGKEVVHPNRAVYAALPLTVVGDVALVGVWVLLGVGAVMHAITNGP